jgi:uncharacterized 2Fe-2S/4Fe-4S cluster protein (DUF4445 family)
LEKKNVTVVFQPSGRRGRITAGKSILDAAQELGVAIESVCGAKQVCGKCRVRVEEGFFAREGLDSRRARLSPLAEEEKKFIAPEERESGYRLACMARMDGDALVYVPEESRGKNQVIRKEVRDLPFRLDPAVKAYFVRLPAPTLEEPLGDFERLLRELRKQHGLEGTGIDSPALRELPRSLRNSGWEATVLVWMDREILAVLPGRAERYYGLAVDIGTTTVAAYLLSLADGKLAAADSMMNPQVTYGEDVMSRISYCMQNPGEGLPRMQGAIIGGLNRLIRSVSESAGVTPQDIFEMTVVGNTAMHHLFLGIDPLPLGLSPFPPALHRSFDLKARELGLDLNPGANVHVLPVEAGFVGADNVGVLIAETPYEKPEMALLIDVGTNGELVLGNREKLLSCSCATGPALEGAHLRFGMRAAPGAIERVRIDPQTLSARFKVVGLDRWNDECAPGQVQARGICGSGIIEALAEMYKAGILEKSGRFNARIDSPKIRALEKGREFILARKEETAIGQDITISIADVRAVQMAKGALYAGAKVMMNRLGLKKVERVVLAGAFGSMIDRERALVLGMFPDCGLENVHSVGNAAGDGARLALLDRGKREEANRIAKRIEYVELTTDPSFTDEFVRAMAFPDDPASGPAGG